MLRPRECSVEHMDLGQEAKRRRCGVVWSDAGLLALKAATPL